MFQEFLLVVAALSGADADLRQQVICAETGFSRAAEARDTEKFLSYVDADARFVAGSISRGREEVGEAWAPLLSPEGPSIRWRPAVIEVLEDGTIALSRGPYRIRYTDEDGNDVETWGHFNSIWRRDSDGLWKVVVDVGGDAGMTPTDEEIEVLAGEPDCP